MAAPGLLWILQTKTAQEVTRDPQDKLEQPRARDNQRDTPLVYTHLQKKDLATNLGQVTEVQPQGHGGSPSHIGQQSKKTLEASNDDYKASASITHVLDANGKPKRDHPIASTS